MNKIKILIDTDLGDDVDDMAAFMLALAYEEIEIVGVTTVFKDTVKRAHMVKDLLLLYGRGEIPVCSGYGDGIIEHGFREEQEPLQYDLVRDNKGKSNKAAQTGENADDFIIKKVRENDDLIILAMGPLTNIALAFLKEPELMKNVRIIGMGGSYRNSQPEWNIVCDPEAAAIVIEKSQGMIMMGLDVTKYLRVDEKRLLAWKQKKDSKLNYFLKGVEIFQRETGFPVTFHDALLVAYLIDPDVVSLEKANFAVELSGRRTRGTMVDLTNYYELNPKVTREFYFAKTVDVDRFFKIIDRKF